MLDTCVNGLSNHTSETSTLHFYPNVLRHKIYESYLLYIFFSFISFLTLTNSHFAIPNTKWVVKIVHPYSHRL